MKYRHRVLGMLFLLSMITYIDRVCIAFAGPKMQDDLGLTPEQYGLVVSAFALAYMIFEIPSGSWGDKSGPRALLTRIVVWWSVFTSLTGLAANYVWLLIVRFLFGAGEAGAYPNSSGAISRWFPATERAQAQGIVWMASRIGGAITPFLVVPIQARFGWRASFWVFGILGIIWAVVWYAWFRDHPSEKKGVTPQEIEEIGAGATRAAHISLPWGSVLTTPRFWLILLMYHLYCYGAFFFLSWYPTYLVRGRGFSDTDLLSYSWLPFVLGAIANMAGGFVSDHLVKRIGLKWGRRTVGLIGLGFSAAFILATALVPQSDALTTKLLVVAFLAIGFAASDFMLPVAWAVCLDVGRKYAGAVTGAMNTAFGFVVTAFGGNYNAPLYPMAALMALSTLLWLVIDPTKQLVDETTPEISFSELYLSFQGRITRVQYWLAGLAMALVALVGNGIAYGIVKNIPGAWAWILAVILVVSTNVLVIAGALALNVKRCHDRDRSGWFCLVGLIPPVSIWYLIEIGFRPGTDGPNQFGAAPLGRLQAAVPPPIEAG